MAFQTPDVDVKSLFNVKGLIAVITGGGSGQYTSYKPFKFDLAIFPKVSRFVGSCS